MVLYKAEWWIELRNGNNYTHWHLAALDGWKYFHSASNWTLKFHVMNVSSDILEFWDLYFWFVNMVTAGSWNLQLLLVVLIFNSLIMGTQQYPLSVSVTLPTVRAKWYSLDRAPVVSSMPCWERRRPASLEGAGERGACRRLNELNVTWHNLISARNFAYSPSEDGMY